MGGEGAVIFTYGTLKRGWFSNHGLMQEKIRSGDASFLGTAHTCDPLPLVCGPYHVPFLLNFPGAGQHVRGELYSAAPARSRAWTSSRARAADTTSGCRSGSRSSRNSKTVEAGRRWRWKRTMLIGATPESCGGGVGRGDSRSTGRRRRRDTLSVKIGRRTSHFLIRFGSLWPPIN